MNMSYARDLDLNLLRVFVVVAEEGSVTAAAARLYLTQPAVSSALKRLAGALGAPVFRRQGRGLALTARGGRLLTEVRPHLEAIVRAALRPEAFDPKTSTRTLRLGLADGVILLVPLLRVLAAEAPGLRLVVLPVQFRTVGEAFLHRRVDLAVSVADELPAGVARQTLYQGEFVCLFDPRHLRLPRAPSRERYLAEEHVIVSYNGDLRGVLEDAYGVERRVRCSVASFEAVGEVVDGAPLLATVPGRVAEHIRRTRPHLKTAAVPFDLGGTPVELLWQEALADDPALAFVRDHIVALAAPRPRRAR